MNNPQMETEPSDSTVLLSALGWTGVILIFILILGVAYLPKQAVNEESRAAVDRILIRDQMTSEQTRLVAAYEWVNQPEGIIRIPVERAMELMVEELRSEQQSKEEKPL